MFTTKYSIGSIRKAVFHWVVKTALMFVFIFISLLSNGFPQVKNIGTPFIRNYDRIEYKAGLQTWMISDAPNGLMYFANNDGVIELLAFAGVRFGFGFLCT